jgi:thioredoxin:protein disulfide reductase
MTFTKKLLVSLLVALCAIGGFWLADRAVKPTEATWDQAVTDARQGKYQLIHTDEIRQLIEEAPQKMLLIDARDEKDFRAGHIPGAINVPMGLTFWSQWKEKRALGTALGQDKNRFVVFYCADLSCSRSELAARVAVELGHTNVYRDPKGFSDWQEERLPVSKAALDHFGAQKGQGQAQPLFGWQMIWTLLGVFVGGLALNLTPCVYPLIPITVSYFGSRLGQSRRTLAVHSLLYVGGLALTNSILGVVAALTGTLIGSVLQQPIALVLVALVMIALATSLFGLWELRLPARVTNLAATSYSGYFGSLFMGLTLGVVAAPCVGPFVLGLLTWVASVGSPWMGFLVFFTLSLGLGLPLCVVAFASGSLERLPGSGEWMLWVRKLMGWILVGMAAYFVGPLLPHVTDVFLLAAVLVAASLHLGWIDGTDRGFKGFKALRTAVGLAGLAWAAFMIGSWTLTSPSLAWRQYSAEVLAQARQADKPIIMDFSASWCAPCQHLEKVTFKNPELVKEAQRNFVMVKVDLTQNVDNKTAGLLAQFKVKGVPTIVFLNARGQERTDLRVVGAAPAEIFLKRMAQLKDDRAH